MKTRSDAERFARYQSVVNVLLSKDPFHKPEIYEAPEHEEKRFRKLPKEAHPKPLIIKDSQKCWFYCLHLPNKKRSPKF